MKKLYVTLTGLAMSIVCTTLTTNAPSSSNSQLVAQTQEEKNLAEVLNTA